MRINKFLLSIILLVLPTVALAAGGGGHHDGIPSIVWLQTANFAIFALILGYLILKKVPPILAQKRETYFAEMKKATAQREAAEKDKADLVQRLEKLKATTDESIQNAQTESQALKEKMLTEANEIAGRVRSEAVQSVKFEAERAKLELKDQLIEQAVDNAREILKTKMQESDQKRLQSEFVEKIQVVN